MQRTEIKIPNTAVSENISQHLFWIKKVGDMVKAGGSVASVEASKGINFIASPVDGILDEIVVPQGEYVERGQIIGYVR
ncbi:MAG: lipoyl domain-containing protein [Eggerthellaceae bacterium]|jgi:biotin carboxyl carrier protein|nr:lipoyl domain-containing protein [Eggerthellaceae bacterium]